MVHTSLKYIFWILSMFYCSVLEISAQNYSDRDSNYEFIEKNDSTIELRVSINGNSGKAEYFKLKSEEKVALPKFQGKYKNCLVFMYGYGQHYRLLTVFQVCNGKIIRDDYEHSMCMEPYKKESYLFFYNRRPIKMTYNYKNDKVKFRKLRNKGKYNRFKGEVIFSCKNRFFTNSQTEN